MKNEIRSIRSDVSELVNEDESLDPGSWLCYGNVFGYLDSHGTITIPGCFLKSIPDFLKTGFSLDTHGAMSNYVPTMKTTLGYFINAGEDDNGLFLEGVFHSTHAGQDVRKQLIERQSAGLTTGMSIGFTIEKYTRIFPQDYETELPKYLQAKYLLECLSNAQAFMYVDIIEEATLIECSITTIPSNTPSLISEVRAGGIYSKDANTYISSNLNFTNKNMAEIRVAKKLSKANYDKLSEHLDKMDDTRDDIKEHRKNLDDAHRKLDKLSKEARTTLDSLRDDDTRDEEPEKKDNKNTEDDDAQRTYNDLFNLLDEINNKIK